MKGISPLVAAVLLIAITVSIGTLVGGWISTFTRDTTDTVSNRTTEAVDCTSANLNIEDVFSTEGDPINGSARVIIKNTGFSDSMTIQGADVYNISGGNFTAEGLPISNFNRGALRTLVFNNVSIRSCSGDFSKVVVTTTCGGIDDTFEARPKCAW
jgi:flagellin-like protein